MSSDRMDRIEQRQDDRDRQQLKITIALDRIVDRLDHPVTGDQALYKSVTEVAKKQSAMTMKASYYAGWFAGGVAVGGAIIGLCAWVFVNFLQHRQ